MKSRLMSVFNVLEKQQKAKKRNASSAFSRVLVLTCSINLSLPKFDNSDFSYLCYFIAKINKINSVTIYNFKANVPPCISLLVLSQIEDTTNNFEN